ncbi:MAG: AmmeMemoRadiSam system protein A [Gammaproteobacteria bacterium]
MAVLSFADLGQRERKQLLRIARESIAHGLRDAGPRTIAPDEFAGALARAGASFVTLRLDAALRGCVGSIEARRPLAIDVTQAAFNAAFRDARFPPLTMTEFPDVEIEISVLSGMIRINARDQDELLQTLRPRIDGLLLEDARRRATFLPKVWEQLSDPREFLAALMLKAGLGEGYWSPTLRVFRYQTLCFDEHTVQEETRHA